MKKKLKENSLFHFIEDQIKSLAIRYTIKHREYSAREVFYINFPVALNLISELWRFDEAHFSIEKRVLPFSEFMSPSHLTLTLRHKSLADTWCRIHVYLDEMLNAQARIQTKIFRETSESNEVIKVEEIDLLTEPAGTIIVEGTNLSLEMVKALLLKQLPLLNDLMQQKLKIYVQLKKEILVIEKRLNSMIGAVDIKRAGLTDLNQILEICLTYLEKVKIFNRYSDSEQDQAEYFLTNLKTHLETQIAQRRSRTTEAPEAKDSKEQKAEIVQPLTVTESAAPTARIVLPAKNKAVYVEQLKQLTAFSKIDKVSELVLNSEIFLNLNNDLSILSFDELSKAERVWVNQSLRTLDDVKNAVVERYGKKALTGDLASVKALENQKGFKFDMLAFYADILNLIESGTHSSSKQRELIAIADYFYQSSDIYRSYVRYCMIYRRAIFELSDKLGEMNVSVLIKMFINNNYSAFDLYVRQVGEVNAIHLSYAGRGVNALQGIALMNHGTFDTRPYVQVLIRNGAVLETPHALNSVVSYEMKLSDKKAVGSDQNLSIFEYMRDNPKALKLNKRSFKFAPSRELISLLNELEDANQMIRFILKTNLLRDSAMLLTISEHVNLKNLLMSLVSAAMYSYCNLSMLPSRRAGIHFYSERAMPAVIEETNKLIDTPWSAEADDDSALTVGVMGFVKREESKESSSEITHYLDATNGMVRQLEVLLKKTPVEELADLIRELNKEVMPYLVRHPKLASEYFMALIILKSYHANKKAGDFQELFVYLIRFATLKDRVLKQELSCNPYQVLENIYLKLKLMLGLINPAMHAEILSHPLMEKLRG